MAIPTHHPSFPNLRPFLAAFSGPVSADITPGIVQDPARPTDSVRGGGKDGRQDPVLNGTMPKFFDARDFSGLSGPGASQCPSLHATSLSSPDIRGHLCLCVCTRAARAMARGKYGKKTVAAAYSSHAPTLAG